MRNLLALSLFAFAAASQASTFALSGLALGDTGTLHLTATGALQTAGFGDNTYYAGPFSARVDGSSSFRTFCGDLLDHAQYSSANPLTILDTASMGAGYALAGQLVNKFASTVGDDKVKNAALQGAIWKAIYGSDLTISDGTTGATAQANAYLSADLSNVSSHANFYNTNGLNQGQIAAVPEPASMAALALGGLGLLRRRKK